MSHEPAQRSTEEQFRSLIEHSLDLISIINPDGSIRYCSPSHQTVLGYAPEEVIGFDASEFVHPDDRARLFQLFSSGLRSPGATVVVEFRYRHKNGAWRVLEGSATRLREDSSVAGIVVNSRDITDRRQADEALRQSEASYRELFENASDIVYTHDLDGNFTSVNKAARLLTGYADEEISTFNIVQIVAPEHLERAIEATLRQLAKDVVPAYELDIMARDGHRVTVEVHTRLIEENGQPVGVQGIARDVTERRHAAEELRRAKETAEAANRAKSEFLANMSHEIRTPMNGILGMTELALATSLTAEQHEYLDLVKISARALLTVINDVLDFSKIEARKLDLDHVAFDLRRTVTDVVKLFGPSAQQKGLGLTSTVAADIPEVLAGDPVRLRQILVNLIGNALKFTEHGAISVTVAIAECGMPGTECEEPPRLPAPDDARSAIELHFAVRDTGVGIPPEKHAVIFHAFEQVDGSSTRQYGGTGLGLTISKHLVAMMGGRMWLESVGGEGSTFHFTVRLQPAQPELLSIESAAWDVDHRRLPTSPAEDEHARHLRILVVEDNAVNQKVIMHILHNRGHTVALAGNGREALAALEQAMFDVVLMDVQMPEMDGFEATAAIRARESELRPDGSHIPIIAMTAHAMAGDRDRCLASGMDSYIAKPIDTDELLAAIYRLAPAACRATDRSTPPLTVIDPATSAPVEAGALQT